MSAAVDVPDCPLCGKTIEMPMTVIGPNDPKHGEPYLVATSIVDLSPLWRHVDAHVEVQQ